MKKGKLLVLLFAVFMFFSTVNVNADVRVCDRISDDEAKETITSVKIRENGNKEYKPGDKVYVDVTGLPRDKNVELQILLRTVDTSAHYEGLYLKNIVSKDGNSSSAYFVIPDTITFGEELEVWGINYYRTTDEVKNVVYDDNGKEYKFYKEVCAFYASDEDVEKNVSEDRNVTIKASGKIKIIDKTIDTRDLLEDISVEKNYAYFGGKLTFNVKTAEPVKSATLTFYSNERDDLGNSASFSLDLFSNGESNEFSYTVNTPTYGVNDVWAGHYKLNNIILYYNDNTYANYTTDEIYVKYYNDKQFYEKNLEITLDKPINDMLKDSNFSFKEMKLDSEKTSIGSTVPIKFDWYYNTPNVMLQSVMLNFYDETNKTMFSTYLKTISPETSIIIPSSAKEGEYVLRSITMMFDSYVGETNIMIFDKDSIADEYKSIFEQKIVIEPKKEETNGLSVLYYSSDELNNDIFDVIKKSKENSIITIYADTKTVIPSDLFDSIKETTKQVIIENNKNEWVFNGTDIEFSKPVDVSMKFYGVEELDSDSKIKEALGEKSIVLDFPDNGELPGKALIRIKDQNVFDKLDGDKFYVYHIDENNNKLNKVAFEIQKSYNGYLEFYINHNSKYVITNEEVEDDDVIGKDDDVIVQNEPDANNTSSKDEKDLSPVILGVIVAGVVVLIIAIVFVLFKLKSNKRKQKELSELDNDSKKE